jgi:predicted dehydrogenase
MQALDRGLHVFCEKPLCYTASDADRLIAKRNAAGRVLQVGYMKRFDPSFLLLRELVRGRGETLRMISVEVNDPDWWPFVAHRDFHPGRDVAANLMREGAGKLSRQVAAALGHTVSGAELRGFVNPFCSSMVHDVNLVHGLLDAMGCSTGKIIGSAIFAKGEGGLGTVRLMPGEALWIVSHLTVPQLADYRERVTLYFDDRLFELEFPSPYLNHHPTKLVEKRSEGHHAETIVHRASYHEPFVEELRAWHAAIVSGASIVNPIEDARRDMVLLGAMGRVALAVSGETAT